MTNYRDHPIIQNPEEYRMIHCSLGMPSSKGESPYVILTLEKNGHVRMLRFLEVDGFSQSGEITASGGPSILYVSVPGVEKPKISVGWEDDSNEFSFLAADVVELKPYDIDEMTTVLLAKIEAFLGGKISESVFKAFACAQRDRWKDTDDKFLPPETEADRIYWAAIRDITLLNLDPPECHPSLEDIRMYRRCLRCHKVGRVRSPSRNRRRQP